MCPNASSNFCMYSPFCSWEVLASIDRPVKCKDGFYGMAWHDDVDVPQLSLSHWKLTLGLLLLELLKGIDPTIHF
jgi:hypothetical protein